MPGQPAAVSRAQHPLGGRGDRRLYALAAPSAAKLVVFGGEAAAGAEEGALHGRPAHAHALADLPVGQSLQLAQHEDPVVRRRETAEGAAQIAELLPRIRGDIGPRPARDESHLIRRRERVRVVGQLFGPLGAPELVDAGVARDLIDPGLEGDRALGLPHPTQRGDEHLLGDVLRPRVVADHAVHVGADPAPVPVVEVLERAVVTHSDGGHEILVTTFEAGPRRRRKRATRPGHPCSSREAPLSSGRPRPGAQL
jgi:hypothetical protein